MIYDNRKKKILETSKRGQGFRRASALMIYFIFGEDNCKHFHVKRCVTCRFDYSFGTLSVVRRPSEEQQLDSMIFRRNRI
jgi:predicted cupin superfamily sugar epimerase